MPGRGSDRCLQGLARAQMECGKLPGTGAGHSTSLCAFLRFPLVKRKTTVAILMGTLSGTSVGKIQMSLHKYEAADCRDT